MTQIEEHFATWIYHFGTFCNNFFRNAITFSKRSKLDKGVQRK